MSETSGTASDEWKWRRREAIIRDDYTCQECGVKGGPDGDVQLHVHHQTPAAEGGRNDLENLETLCASCHRSHHSESPVENDGWFEKEYEDDEFLDAIESEGGLAGTTDVADELGIERPSADYRLRQLEDAGRVTSKKIGNSLAWSLSRSDHT
ncbi:HNH endonuclease [Haloarcula vallismortis]|uniref:HNH nuclease domain-containing protein n=2 Tax=Haloarcula vallismortis TaxID=28442 RepID=M0J8E7_HALVA|nr:winged helix-turn-helix domain-containing protein [Haloarcula vallismortis]EMA04274.1 hypothetical protein C437_13977 [Haloarcula vallismortis ATCC 29715]SDX35645.1 HNH endonuclease [Haloarcula vallismortis]